MPERLGLSPPAFIGSMSRRCRERFQPFSQLNPTALFFRDQSGQLIKPMSEFARPDGGVGGQLSFKRLLLFAVGGLLCEDPLTFYGRYLWDILSKHGRFFVLALSYVRALYRAEAGISQPAAMDLVMKPSTESLALTDPQEADALAAR